MINYKNKNIVTLKTNYEGLKQASIKLGCNRIKSVMLPLTEGQYQPVFDQADFLVWALEAHKYTPEQPITLQFIQGPNVFEFCNTL